MITAVVAGLQPQRVGRIPDRLVEVEDAVEGAAGADPAVDRLAVGFPGGGVVHRALERGQGGAEYLQARRVGRFDQVLVPAVLRWIVRLLGVALMLRRLLLAVALSGIWVVALRLIVLMATVGIVGSRHCDGDDDEWRLVSRSKS